MLESCVSCLGAVVNRVSHNYSLVKDCFQKFFGKLFYVNISHKHFIYLCYENWLHLAVYVILWFCCVTGV